MWQEARWLKVPQTEIVRKEIFHGDMTGRFAYFRCEVALPVQSKLTVEITASSRYRLWVNGKSVLSGPCKGDQYRLYYETVPLTDFILPGKNVFCVQVLYCDPDAVERQTDERAAIYGVLGARGGHRLAVEGSVRTSAGQEVATITTGKADWYVWLDNSFFLKSTDVTRYLGSVVEEIDFSRSPARWKEPDYVAAHWVRAEATSSVLLRDSLSFAGVTAKYRITEREIPLLYERETAFLRDFSRRNGRDCGLVKNGSLAVRPWETLEVILDAGAIQNGYPRYLFRGGKGAFVTITYFEKFGGSGSDLRRTDYRNGCVSGLTDTVRLSGEAFAYEPFWVRTFRFVCLTIHAKEEPVTLLTPTFRRTGYPLNIESSIRSSEPWVGKLWDICVRTLENCMMETYMDCPYYEQLQFAMDTRLEALFTYTVTNDYALVRKALLDFHYGMQPEGLTAGKYPSSYLQILPTFSLHYIFMLWEYVRETGDWQTARLFRGDVDRILDYYDRRVGEDGLVGHLGFWEFVDWQPDWAETGGIPRALLSGPSTIINLMYAYALGCGQQIWVGMERAGMAEEYRSRRESVLDAVRRLCWDEERGMFREGPACAQFTRHAQAWAVLNDLTDRQDAKRLLTNALTDGECLKCTFSTTYEWFRALEKAGMFEEIRSGLTDWIDLLALDCTTCPETPAHARSDCHAWSALPMYEIIRVVAGIRQDTELGGIRIAPHMLDLPDLEGKVVTPYGTVRFRYERMESGDLRYELQLTEGLPAVFVYTDGRQQELSGGHSVLVEKL